METIWHAAVGYVFLTLIVRVLRRRPGAQMTLAEFVLVFLIGGVIILATVGRDRSVTNCTCAVITVGLMHRLISFLKVRYPKFSAVVDGTPLVLVESGKWKDDVLRGAGLSREDVETSARLNQLHGMEEVDSAVLERNGGISIIKREGGDG